MLTPVAAAAAEIAVPRPTGWIGTVSDWMVGLGIAFAVLGLVLLALAWRSLRTGVLVRFTPILFTLFMFFGELLFGVALLLLVGAVLADLRAKRLLPWGPDRPETAP